MDEIDFGGDKMVFVIGGAAQGKIKFVMEHFKPIAIVDGSDCFLSIPQNSACIIHYHLLIKRLMLEKMDTAEFTRKFCSENPNAVIVMNEIGCGIIPLEKNEREWRETVGRCGCIIAEKASIVIRMTCGIPTVIKGQSI